MDTRESGREFDTDGLVCGRDGLPVRSVGRWSKDKHHFLQRYIHAFTTAMKDKPQWEGLGFIDLFSGPGMCRVRETDEEIDGSPLIALGSPKPFDGFVFADKSADCLDAVEQRFRERKAAVMPELVRGDSNSEVDRIAGLMPPRWLHLAFLDPTGLHIHFDTIARIAEARRVDLIISVMDQLDLLRNIREYYYPDRSSNLDSFLCGVDWRSQFDQLPNHTAATVREWFLGLYRDCLRGVGYAHFGEPRRISGPNPYYLLFFASKHPRGADLWNKTSGKDRYGQKSLYQ